MNFQDFTPAQQWAILQCEQQKIMMQQRMLFDRLPQQQGLQISAVPPLPVAGPIYMPNNAVHPGFQNQPVIPQGQVISAANAPQPTLPQPNHQTVAPPRTASEPCEYSRLGGELGQSPD